MADQETSHTQDHIRQLMVKINQAWLKGRPQELKAYFHPDIVFASSNLEIQAVGHQACIDSYQDFLNQAVIRKFTEGDYDIKVWGNTALTSYTFNIEYDINGTEHSDSGIDLFVFTLHEGRWLAAWRLLKSP